MSIAKKCDRCGKMYEQYNMKNDEENPNGLRLLNIDEKQQCYSQTLIDLCPDCMKQLQNWLLNAKEVPFNQYEGMCDKCTSCIHKENYQDEPPCCDCDPNKDAKGWTPTPSHSIDEEVRKSKTVHPIKDTADSLAKITNGLLVQQKAELEARAAELLKENTALQMELTLIKDKNRELTQQKSALEAKVEEITGSIRDLKQRNDELIASTGTYVRENMKLAQENVNLKEKVKRLEINNKPNHSELKVIEAMMNDFLSGGGVPL